MSNVQVRLISKHADIKALENSTIKLYEGDHLIGDTYIDDNEWHLMLVQLDNLPTFNGTEANYVRYDFFATDGQTYEGSCINIKMIAFFNNAAEARAYAYDAFNISSWNLNISNN